MRRRARRAAAPAPAPDAAATAGSPVEDAPSADAVAPARPVGRRARTAAPIDAESTSTRARTKAPDAATAQPVIAANHVTAVRPHAPKAGRRAADAFSDTIEKPAGGRRARIVTPTSAPAADEAVPTPAADEAVAFPAADEAVPSASEGTDANAVVPADAPVTLTVAGTEISAEVVPVEPAAVEPAAVEPAASTAPATRAVSRRTLRSAAAVFDAEPGSASKATPVDAEASAAASGTGASAEAAGGASGAAGSAPRPSGRRVRRGDIAKGAFSIVAMIFATGIAVATTMPASAWHAASDTPSSSVVLASSVTTPGQELTTSAEAAVSSVARDGYAVRDTVAELRAAGMRVADTFTNNPTGAIQWPFPVGVPISDYFGHRESPGGIGSTDHKGVDFTPGQGTTIQSIADGVVSFVQISDNGGLGVHVIVDHVIDGQKVSSVYGHMLAGSITVTEGQVVKVAQPVGQVGNTGTSTGAHLHLEIRLDGTTPVDPYAWLQTHAV